MPKAVQKVAITEQGRRYHDPRGFCVLRQDIAEEIPLSEALNTHNLDECKKCNPPVFCYEDQRGGA